MTPKLSREVMIASITAPEFRSPCGNEVTKACADGSCRNTINTSVSAAPEVPCAFHDFSQSRTRKAEKKVRPAGRPARPRKIKVFRVGRIKKLVWSAKKKFAGMPFH